MINELFRKMTVPGSYGFSFPGVHIDSLEADALKRVSPSLNQFTNSLRRADPEVSAFPCMETFCRIPPRPYRPRNSRRVSDTHR